MSRTEELLKALLEDGSVGFEPQSRIGMALKACCEGLGCDGLPEPQSRTEILLHLLAEKLKGGGGGSYEQGFEDGKASVKHITFNLYTDYGEPFCATSGMTWREWIDAGLDFGSCPIKGEEVYYYNGVIRYATPDAVIVEDGIYEVLMTFNFIQNSQTHRLYYSPYNYVWDWVASDFNNLGFRFDDEGCLVTEVGEEIYELTEWGEPIRVSQDSYFNGYDWVVLNLGSCYVSDFDNLNFEEGMTWADYHNSSYWGGSTFIDEDGAIVHYYDESKRLHYNGVKVKSGDVMIDGATYELG